jgi:catechol 2,3-dioxygenase-like lactoylglutathione lyase family enzyme
MIKHEHTHLTSTDPEKAIEFYTQVMGAKVTREIETAGMRMVDLDLGGIPVRISGATVADDAWKGPRFGLHHLGLEVNNMDEVTAELKSKGVEFVVEPTQPKPGVKTAFIKAPDNVLFELIERKES